MQNNELTTETRILVDHAMKQPGERLLAIMGPCAPEEEHIDQLLSEADELRYMTRALFSQMVGLYRIPVWKPRSDPESWHGMETTHPEEALDFVKSINQKYGIAGIEIGKRDHIEKYIADLAFAWTGARNIGAADLQIELAASDMTLPLGVKNSLDGHIDSALDAIARMSNERPNDAASISLIFRGGNSLTTPDEWANAYAEVADITNGSFIVDVAHASEMAHDPEGQFKKTNAGQIACMDHVIELAQDGIYPAGIMCEASNTPRCIDPVIPTDVAADRIIELRRAIFMAQRGATNGHELPLWA